MMTDILKYQTVIVNNSPIQDYYTYTHPDL